MSPAPRFTDPAVVAATVLAARGPTDEVQGRGGADESVIVEGWAQGFNVGALVFILLIVLCNYRRHNTLHKLILLEVRPAPVARLAPPSRDGRADPFPGLDSWFSPCHTDSSSSSTIPRIHGELRPPPWHLDSHTGRVLGAGGFRPNRKLTPNLAQGPEQHGRPLIHVL